MVGFFHTISIGWATKRHKYFLLDAQQIGYDSRFRVFVFWRFKADLYKLRTQQRKKTWQFAEHRPYLAGWLTWLGFNRIPWGRLQAPSTHVR